MFRQIAFFACVLVSSSACGQDVQAVANDATISELESMSQGRDLFFVGAEDGVFYFRVSGKGYYRTGQPIPNLPSTMDDSNLQVGDFELFVHIDNGTLYPASPNAFNRPTPFELGDWIFQWIVIGALIYFAWTFLLRPSYDVLIQINANGQTKFEGLRPKQEGKITTFLQAQRDLPETLTILGKRQPNGRLKIRCKGHVDSGLEQRIRNFFLNDF